MVVRRSASAVSSPASGRELVEFLDGMAQPVALALGALDLARDAPSAASAALAPRLPERCDPRGVGLEPAEGVEQAAVRRGIDQRAVVVLAVDFDQRLRRAP